MPDLGTDWDEIHRMSQRVSVPALEGFTASLLVAAGMPHQDASTMARILVEQDTVGGRMSHGTACVGGRKYPRHIAARLVNPTPQVSVVSETPTTRVFDGDGGMGHIYRV